MTCAPLWRRLTAMAYDILLLVAIWLCATALLMLLSGGLLADAARPAWLKITEQLFLIATTYGFFIGFWTHGGQTLGMRAWRLQLVTTTGDPVSLAVASWRFVAALPSILAGGLGYLWALIDRERCTWHDRLTGTRVIVLPKQP